MVMSGGGGGGHAGEGFGLTTSMTTPWDAARSLASSLVTSAAAAAVVLCVCTAAPGAALAEREFNFEDIPQGLSSGESVGASRGPNLATLVKGPNGKVGRAVHAVDVQAESS
jgi:hypothetical protein